MDVYKQIELKKRYLQTHPCLCKKTTFIQISFPYCSEGYFCKTHCSLWFALYHIDFEKFHEKDPENIKQLTLW